MKNYIQPGDLLEVTFPATRAAGAGVLVGDLFGVTEADTTSGAVGAIRTRGVFLMPKATGAAWTLGAIVYWDNSNLRFTTTASGNRPVGCAAVAAASGDATGYVRLNGVPAAAAA